MQLRLELNDLGLMLLDLVIFVVDLDAEPGDDLLLQGDLALAGLYLISQHRDRLLGVFVGDRGQLIIDIVFGLEGRGVNVKQ